MVDARIIIAGGGTGGHLYPAIAIGEELQNRNPRINIHYVGSTFGIESEVLPVKALPHTLIPIRGIQRGFSLESIGKNFVLPVRYLISSFRTKKLFQEFNPHMVVGTGGYASALPIKVAINEKKPFLLQEQNSYPGITTRMFSKKAKAVCIAFDDVKKYLKGNCINTGNPTRKEIHNGLHPNMANTFQLDPFKKTIFLFGGSQGSIPLNRIMDKAIESFKEEDIQILWQTGFNHYSKFRHFDCDLVRVVPYVNQMAEAYAISNLIISRAGALTLSEISLCGKPSILIPFPSAAGNHQMKNAEAFSQMNAALIIEEKDLNSFTFIESVLSLLHDKDKLNKMAQQTKTLSKPEATNNIVDQILKVIN